MKHTDAKLSEAATPVSPAGTAAGPSQSSSPSHVLRALDAARASASAALVVISVLGTYAGVVYWIAQGWTLGVVLSVLIPGFGLISTLWSLVR